MWEKRIRTISYVFSNLNGKEMHAIFLNEKMHAIEQWETDSFIKRCLRNEIGSQYNFWLSDKMTDEEGNTFPNHLG
jgi:hypothetical protein